MGERVNSHACPNILVPEPEFLSDAIAMLWPEAVVDDESWPQPQAEPQFTYEETEIKSYLWPFDNNTEPKTLQEIGFELNLTPEMMYLFIPSSLSSHFVDKVAENGMEPMPNHQLLQPTSQVLPIIAANHSEEERSMMQERVGDVFGMPSGAAKQKKRKSPTKKPMKKRSCDDDSWMPEGWVKKVNQRPFKGKFPGYVDKKYYAPGVARAFRSKIEALRYIEKLRNATAAMCWLTLWRLIVLFSAVLNFFFLKEESYMSKKPQAQPLIGSVIYQAEVRYGQGEFQTE
ncbi:hypothetical protein Pfo_011497 [Paulownia fortunei]|nr:hypothetical protein Pfo_011497 [Paulownia fortunei]